MKAAGLMSWALVLAMGCSSGTSGPDKTAQSAPPPGSNAPPPGSNAPPSANVPELVPGVSVGPVRIGMTRSDLDGLGLGTKPGPLGTDVSVGPYVASMDGDRVGAVHVDLRALPSGLRVGGKVFDGSAKIEVIAESLRNCGPLQRNEGANVIPCESGRALVIAGGPPGIVSVHAVSPERAAKKEGGAAPDTTSEATWKHPGMEMTLTYPDKLLKVAQKPDGATLTSEILGTIEDRSGEGKDKPSPLTITISVRVGKLLDVVKSSLGPQVATQMFPKGNEASFKEEKLSSERMKISGANGYRIHMGSHDAQQHVAYAELKPGSTLEVTCSYVGDMAKPKVPMATQMKACDRVLSTLMIKL